MDIYHEYLPFTINLPLRMAWWWGRMEVREQSRRESSKVLLEKVAVVFESLAPVVEGVECEKLFWRGRVRQGSYSWKRVRHCQHWLMRCYKCRVEVLGQHWHEVVMRIIILSSLVVLNQDNCVLWGNPLKAVDFLSLSFVYLLIPCLLGS